MKAIHYILLLCCFASFVACEERDRLDHFDMDAPAPVQIQNVQVHSYPGEVYLTYDIPKDPNLSHIEARYQTQSTGIIRESKSSIYTDTLKLNGFGDTLRHEVQIFSVGKNKKKSDPVVVSVNAKKPPVHSVFESIEVKETFGGVNIFFSNTTQANLVVYLLVDSTGQNTWAPANTFFTNSAGGRLSTRGYEPELKKFAVYVEDRWSNKSDTIYASITPLKEDLIPKASWRNMRLPSDTFTPAEAYVLENAWNGVTAQFEGFASSNSSTLPQHFSVDLGKEYIFSRFKVHQFAGDEHQYNGSGPYRFELYGSNNPDPSGNWNGWDLLGSFESFKPSGLPRGQNTDEDRQYGSVLGMDFEFENSPPPYRYIRFRTIATYGSFGQVCIGEITFWGQ